jgi:GNAT superfamily N-acetyltransferase
MISNEGIADNLYSLYGGLAEHGLVSSGRAGGFEFVKHEGFAWPNMAYRGHRTDRPAGRQEVRLLKESVALHDCPGLLILDKEELTAEMQEALAEERFVAVTEWVNMAMPVGGSKLVSGDLFECRTVDVEDPDEWGKWASIVSNVLFKGEPMDPALFRHPAVKKQFILITGYADGVPVATCLLYLAGNPGLYMVATQSSQQGKGFGRRLVEHAQAEAGARGYEFVVLHSTRAGLDFYNKLGYGAFGKLVLYFLMPG